MGFKTFLKVLSLSRFKYNYRTIYLFNLLKIEGCIRFWTLHPTQLMLISLTSPSLTQPSYFYLAKPDYTLYTSYHTSPITSFCHIITTCICLINLCITIYDDVSYTYVPILIPPDILM